jgi:3-isopropylmalate/(R)-2-methylmalate dehydratase small subunit
MQPLTTLRSTAIVLADDDIDTDQIIPARWLSTTTREGLGAHCLSSRRFDADGVPLPESPFTDERALDARILVAGANFGCGSSREHAVWALVELGIRVVIAPSFADIFASNAAKFGLLTARVDMNDWLTLIGQSFPGLVVDLQTRSISSPTIGDGIEFHVDPFARHCLLRGIDPLGYLVGAIEEIEAHDMETRS